jgi:hypothetical protein
MRGNDAVLSLVGAEMIDEQVRFIDAALDAGIERFYPSEYGSSSPDDEENTRKFWAAAFGPAAASKLTKLGVHERLQKASDEGKISWTAVITGAFFDWGELLLDLVVARQLETASR